MNAYGVDDFPTVELLGQVQGHAVSSAVVSKKPSRVLSAWGYFTVHRLDGLQVFQENTIKQFTVPDGLPSTSELRLYRTVKAAMLMEQANSPH